MSDRPVRAAISNPLLLFLCAVFFLLGFLRLNDLSLYNPDSTRYLIWGNSLAHGRGYVDETQPDPDRYVVHSPLYAALIAPVELFLPLAALPVKIEMICWGIAALILFFAWLERMFGKVQALAGTILLICNPLLLLYSTEILSELPFLVMVLAAMLLVERLYDSSSPKKDRSFLFFLLILPAIALLREVGLAFVAAVVIFLFIRRQPRAALTVLGLSAVILGMWYVRNQIVVGPSPGSQSGNLSMLVQHFATTGSSSIAGELLSRLWLQAKAYFFQLGGMLLYPQYATQQVALVLENSSFFASLRSMFGVGRYVVVLVSLPLLGYGIYDDLRRSRTAMLRFLFALFYLVGIFLYPVHDLRFLFPLLPLMIFYVVRSVNTIFLKGAVEPERRKRRLLMFASLLVMVPNLVGIYELLTTNLEYQRSPVLFYQRLARLPAYPPMFAQPWSMMGSWIRQNTPPGAVIASPAKDIATMVGERKILELDPGVPLPEFEKILRDNRAAYLIAPVRWGDLKVYEFMMDESMRFAFEPVYSVSDLHLMKIHSRAIDTPGDEISTAPAADTMTATGLLRAGRRSLMIGDYARAVALLKRGLQLSPMQPEIIYQFSLANSFAGDTASALYGFQTLLTLPQAGSYLYSTRMQLQGEQMLNEARMSKSSDVVDVRTYDAAALYWNLGYPHRAGELMDRLLREGSQYFVGLLWGFHFAHERGDTSTMMRYFTRLKEIDTSNAVVKVFERLIALDDSLVRSVPLTEQSRLHLAKALLYRQIELFEESIDEGQLSVRDDDRNLAALKFLGEAFERKWSLRSALYFYQQALDLAAGDTVVARKVDSLRARLE